MTDGTTGGTTDTTAVTGPPGTGTGAGVGHASEAGGAQDVGPSAQVRQFLAGVESACADLPAAERARLLVGLEEHLAELNADGVDLTSELGDPAAYARELRSAAGLPTAGLPAVPASVPASVTGAVTGAVTAAAAQAGVRGGNPSWPATTPFTPPAGAATDSAFPTAALPGRTTGGTSPATRTVLLVTGGVLAFIVLLAGAAIVLGIGMQSGSQAPVATPSAPPVSSGEPAPAAVAVPDVNGMSGEQAKQLLYAAGFDVEVQRQGDGTVVVGQEPAAGTQAPVGSVVLLRVGSAG